MIKKVFVMLATGIVLLSSCTEAEKETNPLLMKWDTPFGIPPFEQVQLEHYMPAFEKAMAVHKAEIDAIVNNKKAPTFENTIEALDKAGALLAQVSSVFGGVSGIDSNEEIRAIAKELTPIRSAHSNEINLNEKLFERVKAVYDNRANLNLNREQMRLLTETYKGYERSGAHLPADKKEALKALNVKISDYQLAFGQNLLQETAAFGLLIENSKDLAGLTSDQIAAAKVRAEKAGKKGWLFGLDNPSIMPFLANSDNAALRKKMLDGYLNRGNNNNANDNKEVVKQLADLRLQKAKVMGYDNFAEYVLVDRMAKTPEAVYNLLDQLWTPALKVANQELKDIESIARKMGHRGKIEASDWRYYFEKAKKNKYDLDEEELRPYFKMENVRDGIFYVAERLFGLTFRHLDDVPLPYHEAEAFECLDKDGSHLGILFLDMFSRPGQKNAGAWCGGYRSQHYEKGKRVPPLVTIVCNFSRPADGKPALLTTDETETFFHEFGHALQSLMKDVTYKSLGGMTRDFVELPSQINEHWAFEPEVLAVYAKHYETGEVIPQDLLNKLDKASKYGQGFATTEYLAASYLDMDFHVLNEMPQDLDVVKFEHDVLSTKRGLISQIPPRYRTTYFSHTFGGGYTAGYYSYIWAEVLDCDAYQAFVETGDIFNRAVADKYRKEILAGPNLDEAMTLYVNFRGKEPGIEPLLKNRGLN